MRFTYVLCFVKCKLIKMNKDKIIKHQQFLIDMLIDKKDKAEIEKWHFVSCLRELQCFTGDKDIYQPINNMLNEYLNNT